MTLMLSWPSRARIAIRKLFEPLQDVDVYVEDANDEAFYRALLNFTTGNTVKIARVFALGGRQSVIDAARTHDFTSRRALFIIDGDLGWTRGETAPSLRGLHCHDAYCIENLLICKMALTTILSQEIAITEDDARQDLNYEEWETSIKPVLVSLFAAFAVLNQYIPSEQTVSMGVGAMCTERRRGLIPRLDHHKVESARLAALVAAEAVETKSTITIRYNDIMTRINSLPQPLHAVSGKSFILPLVDFHLQSLGCRIKRKSLRIRLASAGDMNRFSTLSSALTNTAKGIH